MTGDISTADLVVAAASSKAVTWIEYRHIPGLRPGFWENEKDGDDSDGVFGVLVDNTFENETHIWAFMSDNPDVDEAMGWGQSLPDFYCRVDHLSNTAEPILTPGFTPPWSSYSPSKEETDERLDEFRQDILNDCKLPAIVLALLAREESGIEATKSWQTDYARKAKKKHQRNTDRNHFDYLFPKKIRLSQIGQGHASAFSKQAGAGSANVRKPPHQHWVRGHFMKFKDGNLSWRKPHLRGTLDVSPVIVDK
jgi:hypothetical protein